MGRRTADRRVKVTPEKVKETYYRLKGKNKGIPQGKLQQMVAEKLHISFSTAKRLSPEKVRELRLHTPEARAHVAESKAVRATVEAGNLQGLYRAMLEEEKTKKLLEEQGITAVDKHLGGRHMEAARLGRVGGYDKILPPVYVEKEFSKMTRTERKRAAGKASSARWAAEQARRSRIKTGSAEEAAMKEKREKEREEHGINEAIGKAKLGGAYGAALKTPEFQEKIAKLGGVEKVDKEMGWEYGAARRGLLYGRKGLLPTYEGEKLEDMTPKEREKKAREASQKRWSAEKGAEGRKQKIRLILTDETARKRLIRRELRKITLTRPDGTRYTPDYAQYEEFRDRILSGVPIRTMKGELVRLTLIEPEVVEAIRTGKVEFNEGEMRQAGLIFPMKELFYISKSLSQRGRGRMP
jgi:hypothetical protein